MAVNVWGLVAVLVFYLAILIVGLIAGRKTLTNKNRTNITEVVLAGRRLGTVVGVITMAATWVGGGYLNGTAEMVYRAVDGGEGGGLVWAYGAVGISLSLVLALQIMPTEYCPLVPFSSVNHSRVHVKLFLPSGRPNSYAFFTANIVYSFSSVTYLAGIFIAKKLRECEYVTMIDPFQKRLGDYMGALLTLPCVCGEMFYTAAILSALGTTLSVIIGLEVWISTVISAAVSLLYVVLGGISSVVITDVIQLFFILFGLILAIPFACNHHAVSSLELSSHQNGTSWLGHIESSSVGLYIDDCLLVLLGGIPWQTMYQRVLASESPRSAQFITILGGIGCLFITIPPIIIGAIGYSTDWTQTAYNETLSANGGKLDPRLILPLVLQYLTPTAVCFIGLGAVAAAVMSSTDSAILSSSSMFSHNIYKVVIRPKADEREMVWVIRVAAVVICSISTAIAITVDSIYSLLMLCIDFVYVLVFPQLVCTLFVPFLNTFGSFAGFVTSLILRLVGGASYLNWRAPIGYPWYDEENDIQRFPLKTFAMLAGLAVMTLISYLTDWLMSTNRMERKWLGYVNNRLENAQTTSVNTTMSIAMDKSSVSLSHTDNKANEAI